MLISLIVAMDRKRLIGHNNRIPWRLPADLRHFKEITLGKTIVMGRKTYESIGHPLPGRRNIVFTRNKDFSAEGCLIVYSIEEALAVAGEGEVMIIGGGELYRLFLPIAGRVYLTEIEATCHGDTYFPLLDEAEWQEIQRQWHEPDAKNPYRYAFVILERKN